MKIHSVNKADCDLGDGDLQLIELEEGDIVLTKEEKEALAKEISHHYVSYDNTLARSVIRRIID